MIRILVTGATGNVGKEVIHYLSKKKIEIEIIAGVRNINIAKAKLKEYQQLKFIKLDFEISDTFKDALHKIDIIFLVRPPHISNIKKYFKPLLQSAKTNNISKIVFLSVQGAERSKLIPHNKIERLIKRLGYEYIFIRPSYFMQNLTTTFKKEICIDKNIILPSGRALFNWVDTKNVAQAAAQTILNFKKYKNRAFDITGTENKSFSELQN